MAALDVYFLGRNQGRTAPIAGPDSPDDDLLPGKASIVWGNEAKPPVFDIGWRLCCLIIDCCHPLVPPAPAVLRAPVVQPVLLVPLVLVGLEVLSDSRKERPRFSCNHLRCSPSAEHRCSCSKRG